MTKKMRAILLIVLYSASSAAYAFVHASDEHLSLLFALIVAVYSLCMVAVGFGLSFWRAPKQKARYGLVFGGMNLFCMMLMLPLNFLPFFSPIVQFALSFMASLSVADRNVRKHAQRATPTPAMSASEAVPE